MLRTVCQETKQIHQFTMYFIPEKPNVLMTEKEQYPPPKTNQPLPPTKPLPIERGRGVWGKVLSLLMFLVESLKAPD